MPISTHYKTHSLRSPYWRSAALLLLCVVPLLLSACGRRSTPQPPGPKSDIIYPRPYPPE